MKKRNLYDQKYASEEYYWGKQPSAMCDRIIEIMHPSADYHHTLLDLGCGEGRNAVYFAKHGFEVFGLDASEPGLRKTIAYAEEAGVKVETMLADITNLELEGVYDVIFSTGVIHY